MKRRTMAVVLAMTMMVTSTVWAEENELCRLKTDASLRSVTLLGIQGSELAFRPELLRIERDMSPNTVFYSESFGYEQEFGSEQSKEKKTKKGRITGTIIGTGIGGGLGYLLYRLVSAGHLLGGENEPPSTAYITIPAVIGGVIGYVIGDRYDEK